MIPVVLVGFLMTPPQAQNPPDQPVAPSSETLRSAGELAGLDLTDEELEMMRGYVAEHLQSFDALRSFELTHETAPATAFDPTPLGIEPARDDSPAEEWVLPDEVERPDDLFYADIPTLAALVRSREVSCVELTQIFLERLRVVDEATNCVVTFLDERALAQAEELDRELEAGRWRGLLHGIPWGAKDLLAVRGAPTTWGAKPYEEQTFDFDASVVRRLDAAGAVLVAKLSLGALAMGDEWFRGKTLNPWLPVQGSSGSSAGSAAASAAGGVAFAIGSETRGSILSPSARCGNSSLRPTFGRVSRHGAMPLSWSMDKLGPIGRSATDVAIVMEAIQGPDGLDGHVRDLPFRAPAAADARGWKVGVVLADFEKQENLAHVLEEIEALGAELVPIEPLDFPVDAICAVLEVEAASVFEELTRSGRDDLLAQQTEYSWPNIFRSAHVIGAVDVMRANRVRTRLMYAVHELFEGLDLIVHPTRRTEGRFLSIGNLTGHPAFVAPAGFRDNGTPLSVSFMGPLYGDAKLLAFARAWQAATDHHHRHPAL